ncbi:MAG: lysozyme [Actinomycetales bacterium]
MGSTVAVHEPAPAAPTAQSRTAPTARTTATANTAGATITTVASVEPISAAHATRVNSFATIATASATPPGVSGLDVSGWQVLNASNWSTIWSNGGRFVYVKATESGDYVSSQFNEQYTDSYNAGLLHGAYHFATPDTSNGATQANWFLNNGGAGSADGRTMPPLLDIEYNPYGATCYGLSQPAMVGWIQDFSTTVQARTGRLPAIYSTTDWWTRCTGNSGAFAANPLFIARYPNSISDGPGTLPAGWSNYTLWQYADAGVFPGDQDVFNGNLTQLQSFGLASSLVRTPDNASVYLISGNTKYPVTSMDTFGALSPLGPVAYAPQSFLDQFATQQPASRILRAPDGTISFVDSGLKLPFSSCSLVTDYGGSCASTGYVQLTAAQSALYVATVGMTPFMTSVGGPLYYMQSGKRREILDAASESQAGLSGSVNYLSPDAVSYLPLGTPVVRDGVFAMVSGTSNGVLLSGGTASAVDPSASAAVGLPGAAVGSLQAGSVAQLPVGTPFTGAFQVSGSSTVQVLGTDGLHTWAAGVGGSAFKPAVVPAALTARYSSQAPIQAGSAVMSASNATVYLVMPNDIRPISSWDAAMALAGGGNPSITVVPQALLNSLPQGPVALTAGTLVRNSSSATVYLVNGVTNKIAFSKFDFPFEAGFTSFTFTSDDRLNAYPTATTLLGFGILCGSQKYVSAGGSIHAVNASVSGLYPFTFVQLDTFTCALAKKGTDATAFIRTPDGSIYYLNGGTKHPISSMARFQQLSAGQPYLNVVALFGAGIPTGAPA